MPADSVTLDGSASSDSDGSIASYAWMQISKPDGALDTEINNPANVSTTVSGLTAKRKYTFGILMVHIIQYQRDTNDRFQSVT
jgi:hypothetical protein